MNYILIFLFKIMENTLSTLRLILVSNGKKVLGSILIFIVSVVWIISSSIAITNLNLAMILFFSFGSLIGSYIGSLLEEKLALGTNLLLCLTDKNIDNALRKKGYIVSKVEIQGLNSIHNLLIIVIKRNKNKKLVKLISLLDNKSIILGEYTNILYTK